MERATDLKSAQKIMGNNFIGPDDLKGISDIMGVEIPAVIPDIRFSPEELEAKKDKCMLIFVVGKLKNGSPLCINALRTKFGIDPDIFEPCFYNQDWYVREDFANGTIKEEWYLIRKFEVKPLNGTDPQVVSNSINSNNYFIPAILGVYVFFSWYFIKKEILWKDMYFWCSDRDNLGDMIYIGRYTDNIGIKKNGFEIHRHLKIRDHYKFISFE